MRRPLFQQPYGFTQVEENVFVFTARNLSMKVFHAVYAGPKDFLQVSPWVASVIAWIAFALSLYEREQLF
jgi:hypothetical protein